MERVGEKPMNGVKFVDNSAAALGAINAAILRGLERCGQAAEGYAKDLCPVGTLESTGITGYIGGTLRNSISHKIDPSALVVYIGTNVDYAPYVEMGTGIYNPEGRKTPWIYKDEYGNWHWTRGAKAQPFLKPAVANYVQTYVNIMADEMKNA